MNWFLRIFRPRGPLDTIQADLLEAELRRLEAASCSEYYHALERMYSERTERLRAELRTINEPPERRPTATPMLVSTSDVDTRTSSHTVR